MPNAYAENEQLIDGEAHHPGSDEPVEPAAPVVVRRNAGVSALIGLAASAVAIAYLWRASQTMAGLDWLLCAVMAVVAGGYLVSLVDARTPLLVADDLGVRIRLGHEWRGIPWEAIGHVVVHPRRGLFRDGRLVVVPRNLTRALEGLDAKGRRLVALNQKMYGAPLAVPLGLTTRLGQGDVSLADGVTALAQGRTEVVELDPRTLEAAEPADRSSAAADPADASPATAAPAAPTGAEAPEARATVDGAPEADTPAAGTATAETPAAETPAADAPGADAPPGPSPRQFFPRRHHEDEPRPEPEQAVAGPMTGPEAAAEAGVAPEPVPDAPPRPPRRSILGSLGTVVSRMAKGDRSDIDRGQADAARRGDASDDGSDEARGDAPGVPAAPVPPSALRETRPALRAQTTIELPPANVPSQRDRGDQPDEPAEGRALHRPGSVDLVVEPPPADDRVRPISTLGDPVEPLVIDDYVAEPAYDPVIGPEIAAARTRLGLSVDELAERTRIRPHVIESIEVDDFAPCGGDFYARGHLRTLARILGLDPAPLLASFDERYATAPINARRVFEAELATGMTGTMRATAGGPNWGLLIGVVLALVLVWGVLRLFTSAPPADDVPTPVINGAAVVQTGPGPHGPSAL